MPVRAVLLLLSKVTQKHFRQPYRPSKVPLRPAGVQDVRGTSVLHRPKRSEDLSSLRSVWLCPVISLPGYIPNYHGKVSLPDTSSGQHPFPSESVPICHPSKSAGIRHSAIRYRSINPMTKCHIFRCCSCNQVFLLSFSRSPFIHLYRKDALKQGSLSAMPKASVLTSAAFPCPPTIQERATPLSYRSQKRTTNGNPPVFHACSDIPAGLFPVPPPSGQFWISYIIPVPP